MSNLVLQSIQNPPNINFAWPVKKAPNFKTIVQSPASERGVNRIPLQIYPVYDFEYDFNYIKGDFQTLNTAFSNLIGFYNRMRGAAEDWLFLDPYDNVLGNGTSGAAHLFGYGDGATTQFQVTRTLNSPYGIQELMQNIFPTAFYINNAAVPAGPQASGNQWYCGLENWLAFSQDFSNAAWVGSGVGVAGPTVTANTTVSPDGTTTADTLAFPATAGGQTSQIGQTVLTGTPGTQFTYSVWLKLASGTHNFSLMLQTSPNISAEDKSTAIVVTGSWVRYSVTGTFGPTGSTSVFVGIQQPVSQSSVNLFAWGGQLERWSSATSYVATTATVPVYPRGQVTFTIAPGNGLSLKVDMTYYYRCRFVDDEFSDLSQFMYQLFELKSMKFRSLLL